MEFLFVYGTLRRTFQNQFARMLAERESWRGLARMQGRLYDLGRYPGAVLSNAAEEWVVGELYELHDGGGTLAALDDYEGGEYTRVPATVLTEAGQPIAAWVYVYNHAVAGQPQILSGDYLNPLGPT